MRKWRIIFCFFIVSCQLLLADEQLIIDSLKNNLSEVESDKKVQNYLLIAENYRSVDTDSTIKFGILAIQQSKLIENKEREAFSLRALGVSYFYFSDYDNAMHYFRKGLKTYQSIDHKLGISNCFNGIGRVFERGLELDSAQYYLNQALQLRIELNDSELIAAAYVNIGNLYYYRNQLSIALEYYMNALIINKNLNLAADLGDVFINLGIVYNELHSFDKALVYYSKADSIFRKIRNNRKISTVLLNKADIYNFHLKDYDEALKLYNESLAIKINLNEKSGIALIHNNIGAVYGNMVDYKSALMHLEKAKQLYNDLDNQAGLIMVNYNLGNVYFALGNYKKAIDYFLSSLTDARKTGFNDYISLNYAGLYKTYAYNGDFKNFEKYLYLDNHITDSLLSNLENIQMLEVEARFLANDLQKENINLKDHNSKLDSKARIRLYIIIGLTILIISIITFQILYYFSSKKKHN